MKLLGSIAELVNLIFRTPGNDTVTITPAEQTVAAVTITIPDAILATETMVLEDTAQTLTNKTIDSDNNTITNIVNADIKAGAAIDATKIADGSVTSTEFQTLSDINTASTIQAQLNAKQATITGAASTIASSDLTVSRALASDASGKVAVSSVTSTELGYVSGVSSAIQTQLGGKEPTISVLTTAKGGTGVNSTATFPSTGTVVTRDSTDTLLNKTTISSTGLATGALTLPTGNSTTERPTGTAAQLKGMVRYNDTDDVFEGYNELSGWSSIGGGGTTDRVTQASHAFAVGEVLYLNGATYTKARADVANTAEVVGMVSRVIDANIFEITLSGEVSGLTGLTAGEVYFLSPITAGATTTTEPSVVGQVSLPVGIASSTTTLYVQPKRGVLVGATNVRTQIALANNATTTVQNVSAYDAGELSGSVVIAATTSLRFFVSAQFSRNGAGTNYNVSYQASGDVPPVGFQVTITSAGLLQVVMPSVAGFTSAAITYGLDVAAVGATLPLSISARNVIGDVSGTAVPAGYIGEVLSQSRVKSAAIALTTATPANVTATSLTLTPGVWLLSGTVGFRSASSTSVTALFGAISTTSATIPVSADTTAVPSSTGQIQLSQERAANVFGSGDNNVILPPYVVVVTVNTPYFLVAQSTFTVSTMSTYGYISAVRVA